MRALKLASSIPWAITPDALRLMLQIAAREAIDPEAVSVRAGRPLENTRRTTTRAGVATIPVSGPIFRHASFFTEVCGATSVSTLAADFHTALQDPNVEAIVLEVDSPGGEVAGVSELAGMIAAARGTKPVTAYIDGQGASAAYWIASAADEIVVADTAMVGSIGVVAVIPGPDPESANDVEIVSSQSPNKRPDATTEDGRALIQANIDALADVFVGAVAENRGVDVETVLSDFGQGGVFVGQQAVDAGLADRVGTYEGVLASLTSPSPGGSPAPTFAQTAEIKEFTPMANETNETVAGEHVAAVKIIGQSAEPMRLEAREDPRIAELEAKLKASEARAAAAEAVTNDAINRVAAIEAENRKREFAAMAKGWIGATDTHVTLLEKLDDESRALYIQQQNATAEQARVAGLFKTAGVIGSAEPDESPLSQLQAIAAAKRRESGMSAGDAFKAACNENPDLYTAYTKEIKRKA